MDVTPEQIHQLVSEVTRFSAALDEIRRELKRLNDAHIREEARRDALAEQEARLRELPDRVSDLDRRLQLVERRQEADERPVIVHDDEPSNALKDPEVRAFWLTVTKWAAAALVLSALAIGGGLTFGELRPYLPGSPPVEQGE